MITTQPLLLNPITIGDVQIENRLFLAPMAGHTNYPFRLLCRETGDCGLVCTELISSTAMQHDDGMVRAKSKFDWFPHESPFAVQLFGADPYEMAEAAKIVADHGANIVDINMGCWVPKIAKTGGGAALLKDVCTAAAVVEAVVSAVTIPVTVKIRSGWERNNPTAVPFARAARDAGVAAITVHARFASQGFGGEPDWSIIRQVKDEVGVLPVIGNGDVLNAADAQRMVDETGCDAVMVGRGALGKPWMFRHIAHTLRTGEHLPEPSVQERAATALRQAQLTVETTPRELIDAIRILRNQIIRYTHGVPHAARIRAAVGAATTLDEIETALQPILSA